MNKETKEALEGSIKHWERMIKSTTETIGIAKCQLCELFYYDSCIECPVFGKTSTLRCANTPYVLLERHIANKHGSAQTSRKPYCKECLRLAREELKFLESLRED